MLAVSYACVPPQVCCLTNPIWVVKTRLQLQRRSLQQAAASAAAAGTAAFNTAAGTAAAAAAATPAGSQLSALSAVGGRSAAAACAVEYRGFLHAFVHIARCEGLAGLYRGLLPSLLLVRARVAAPAATAVQLVPT